MSEPNRVPAEVFPPGEFLRDELEARGWTQSDLAEILARPLKTVNEVIQGKKTITPETALGLSAALGTSPQYWMNLDSAYQLYRSGENESSNEAVAIRARLFARAPVKEMVKRGWIEASENARVLEKRICDFFQISSSDEEPHFYAAARMAGKYESFTPAQNAWLYRARELARMVSAQTFSASKLPQLLGKLKALLHSPEETRHTPRLLAEHGIRLVIVESLSRTKIDGACFWLDRNSPVIALSLRYKRLDYFWHTLMHEIGHVKNEDGLRNKSLPLDVDLPSLARADQADIPAEEMAANAFAASFLVDPDELEDFIARTAPLYSKAKIKRFANRIQVHPGIVVGQLQFRGEIEWSHSRDLLANMREIVAEAALTDGWGSYVQRTA